MEVTKQQLQALFDAKNKLNTDNGRVLSEVVGQRHKTKNVWGVDVLHRALSEGEELEEFSLKELLGGKSHDNVQRRGQRKDRLKEQSVHGDAPGDTGRGDDSGQLDGLSD